MKPFLIAVVLIASHVAHAQQTDRHTRSGTDVMERVNEAQRSMNIGLLMHPLRLGDETPVLVMEPLQSTAFRELFRTLKAYRMISSRDIIHHAKFSVLLIDTNGLPGHLQTDDEVASFLGRTTAQVKGPRDALLLIQAFADLRSYRIVESAPDFPDVREPEKQPASLDTDYKFVTEEGKDRWTVFATLFTSEYSGSYERYIFTIYKAPGRGIALAETVVIRLRSYVY